MEEEDLEELSLNLKDRKRKKNVHPARPVRKKKKPVKFNTSTKKKANTISTNKKANSLTNSAKKYPDFAKKSPDSAKSFKKPAKKRKYRKKIRPAEKKLACADCGLRFHYNCQLQEHRLIHTGEKPYVCDVCDKAFNTAYSLKTHKYIHTNEKPFKCAFCPYACRDSSTLRKHQLRHVGIQQRYQCKICDKEFKNKHGLKLHVAELHLHLDMKRLPCEQCDKLFKSKASLDRHIKQVHLKSLVCTCPICDKELSSSGNLGLHMLIHQDARPYVCNYPGCKKAFKSSSTLSKHSFVHKENNFACTLCQRELSRPDHLKNHYIKVHRKVKRVQCDYCKVKFLTKNYLIKHIREKHYKKKKKLKCDMCRFTTRNKPSLIGHIKGHKNADDKECRICHKIYKKHEYLKAHYQRTHNVVYKTKKKAKPLMEIKEEPLDDEKSIDLFEIEKHELVDPYENNQTDIEARTEDEKTELTETDTQVIEARAVTEDEKTELTETILKGYLSYHTVKMPIVKKERKCSKYEVDKKAQEQAKKTISKLLTVAKQKQAVKELEKTRQLYNERMKAIANGTAKKDQTIVKFFKKDKVKGKSSKTDNAEICYENDDSLKGTENENSNIDKTDDSQEVEDSPKEFVPVNDGSNIDDNSERVEDAIATVKNSQISDNSNITEAISINNKDIHNTRNSDKEHSDDDNDPLNFGESKTLQKEDEKDLASGSDDENISSKYDDESKNMQNKEDSENSDDDDLPLKYFSGNKTLRKKNEESLENNNDDDKCSSDDGQHCSKEKTVVKEKAKKINKLTFNFHQCYTCFKLYPTKEELIDHCKDHFDICNIKLLKKCPLCDYVTKLDIKRHLRLVHHIDLKIHSSRIKDNKDNTDGSPYYYEIDNPKVKKLEVIPSIKNLNKIAYQKLDEKSREEKSRMMTKTKLVKKGKEWVVETEKVKVANDLLLPEIKDLKINAKIGDSDAYLDGLKKLYHANKKSGKKMVFPCQHCEKICQNLAALKLHLRKHDPNKKPFKPKKWKHKLKKTEDIIKTDDTVTTDANILDINKIKYLGNHKINPDDIIRAAKMFGKDVITADQAPITEETVNQVKDIDNTGNRKAKPKPIMNNHKCDPELQAFYRNCIRGGDIEFWQFLKIFNKMDRENIKDFKDLEGRYDFGIGHSVKDDNKTDAFTSQSETSDTKASENCQNMHKLATATSKLNKSIKYRTPHLNKFKKVTKTHRRVIRLTKEEHRRRILIQKKLRENVAQNSTM